MNIAERSQMYRKSIAEGMELVLRKYCFCFEGNMIFVGISDLEFAVYWQALRGMLKSEGFFGEKKWLKLYWSRYCKD